MKVREAVVKYRQTGVELIAHNPTNSEEVYELFESLDLVDACQESFYIMAFDTRQNFIGYYEASRGSLEHTIVDPRTIFSFLLSCGASRFIAVHNHPSGDPEPSKQDALVTKRLKECGNLMEVCMIDHIIVAERGYFSFNDNNRM